MATSFLTAVTSPTNWSGSFHAAHSQATATACVYTHTYRPPCACTSTHVHGYTSPCTTLPSALTNKTPTAPEQCRKLRRSHRLLPWALRHEPYTVTSYNLVPSTRHTAAEEQQQHRCTPHYVLTAQQAGRLPGYLWPSQLATSACACRSASRHSQVPRVQLQR